jgi:hypothetical protein
MDDILNLEENLMQPSLTILSERYFKTIQYVIGSSEPRVSIREHRRRVPTLIRSFGLLPGLLRIEPHRFGILYADIVIFYSYGINVILFVNGLILSGYNCLKNK